MLSTIKENWTYLEKYYSDDKFKEYKDILKHIVLESTAEHNKIKIIISNKTIDIDELYVLNNYYTNKYNLYLYNCIITDTKKHKINMDWYSNTNLLYIYGRNNTFKDIDRVKLNITIDTIDYSKNTIDNCQFYNLYLHGDGYIDIKDSTIINNFVINTLSILSNNKGLTTIDNTYINCFIQKDSSNNQIFITNSTINQLYNEVNIIMKNVNVNSIDNYMINKENNKIISLDTKYFFLKVYKPNSDHINKYIRCNKNEYYEEELKKEINNIHKESLEHFNNVNSLIHFLNSNACNDKDYLNYFRKINKSGVDIEFKIEDHKIIIDIDDTRYISILNPNLNDTDLDMLEKELNKK